MSSHPPSDAPSPAPEPDEESGLSLVSLLRTRGAPLIDALETHFPGSREYGEAAASYAFAAAVELGLTRASAELVRETAKLHEIGRIYVPTDVLRKPASERTLQEAAQVQAHHEWGAQLARGAGVPERVCEWIRLGGERYDGGGPNRLAGEAIPLQARISRAGYACYAALSEPGAGDRPLGALHESAGRELDPMVVDALESVLERVGEG